jgi:hypothetical protein
MRKLFFILQMIIMIFLSSCQKDIVVPQPPYDSRVSIQGLIEPDSIPVIYFNKTVPYFANTTNTADLVIRNATIKISSGNSTDSLTLDSILNRVNCKYIYFYKGTVPIQWNTTYTLSISSGAETYTATSTTTLSAVSIDSVSYTATFKDIYGEHEGVIVYFKDIPSQTNYYRYEMLRPVDASTKYREAPLVNPCLGNDMVQVSELGRSVYNDKNVDGQQIKIVVEPAYSHNQGLVCYVRMQTIDKAVYDFYDQLDKQKLSQLNPFVEPVFLKDGQFGSKAVGFFGCKTLSAKVKFIYPQ